MVKSGAKAGKQARRGPPPHEALMASPSHLMHRGLQLALDIYAEELGPDGLTQRQYAVLEAASVGPGLTQTELVRATGIDRSTLADLVARMTAKGLLERERSALDARAKVVRVSPVGMTALEAARPRVEAADKRILALLPKSKRQGFMDLLGELEAAAAAAPDAAKAEARAARKAAKEAKKAEKAALKAAEKASQKAAKKAEKAARKAEPPANDAA